MDGYTLVTEYTRIPGETSVMMNIRLANECFTLLVNSFRPEWLQEYLPVSNEFVGRLVRNMIRLMVQHEYLKVNGIYQMMRPTAC